MPTPILYTVTFNSNGGSAVSSITVSSGNTVTKPNDPSKYGYTFDGWYKDSALTQVFRFGSNGDKVTGNIIHFTPSGLRLTGYVLRLLSGKYQ